MTRCARFLVAISLACAPLWSPAFSPAVAQSDDEDPVDALYAKTMQAMMRGDTVAARASARAMMAMALKLHGKDSEEYKSALEALAMVAGTSGETNAAVKYHGAATVDDADGAGLTSANLLGRVESLRHQGKIDEALALLKGAEARAKSSDDRLTFQSELGQLLSAKRDYLAAAAAYDRAAELLLGTADPNVPGGLQMLAKKALNLHRAGRTAEAGTLFDQVHARAEADYASRVKSLEGLPKGDQQNAAAIAGIKSALAVSYGGMADDFEAAGRSGQVAAWRRGEFDATQKLLANSPYRAVSGLGLINNLLAQPGQQGEALARARVLAADARGQVRSGSHERAASKAEDVRADAVAPVFEALADADYAVSRSQPTQLPLLRDEALQALQEATSSPVSRALLSAAADARAGALAVDRRRLESQWDRLEARIAEIYSAGEAPQAQQLIVEQNAVDRQLAALDRQIAKAAPAYYSILAPAPLPLRAVQTLLRADEALLLLVPGPRGTQVMAISASNVGWNRVVIEDAAIAVAVQTIRASLDPAHRPPLRGANWAFDRRSAYQLYRQLILPLEPVIAGKRSLFVVAGGALAQLPPSVLISKAPTGSDADPAALRGSAWFGEAFALSSIPSIQALASLRQRPTAGKSARRAFLGFGDPMLGGASATRGTSSNVRGVALEELLSPADDKGARSVADPVLLRRLARLPGTADELRHMRDFVGGGDALILLGADATETAVKRTNLTNLRVLAFATHALPSGSTGLEDAGLVLSPPRRPSEFDDGFLTASEIVKLNLGVDWAILSGCDTAGSGDALAISGLERAFLAGGAESLLVSHWPVFDAVAGELTTRVFRSLKEDADLSRAAALQRAMREIRNMPEHPEYAHPAYWAPFVLVGDGARK